MDLALYVYTQTFDLILKSACVDGNFLENEGGKNPVFKNAHVRVDKA